MGDDTIEDEIDEEAYIGVELDVNHSIVNVRKKRLMLQSEHAKIFKSRKVEEKDDKKKKSNKKSRSRS